MKKTMRRSLVFVLCGLVLLTMAQEVGSVHARSQEAPTIKIEHTILTSSQGTTTVSAPCPEKYHVQSGQVEMNLPQTRMYDIPFNGPNAERTAWTATVRNKTATGLSITVTAICAAT